MSSISFPCPGCGKKFEVLRELAGKKARCKQCGNVMRVPVPPETSGNKQGRPTSQKSVAEPDLYELDQSVAATEARGSRSRATSGSAPFRPGTRIDVLEVAECSPERFVLFDRAGSTLVLVMTGVVALFIGFLAIGGIQQFFAGQGQRMVLTGRAIVGSLFALAYGVVAVSWLGRLGLRLTIDGRARSFTLTRLYFWHRQWSADELGGVVYVVSKANSERASRDELQQSAEVLLVDREDRFVASLGDTSIKLPDIVPLAQSAIHSARLLGLPIWVDVRGKPMAPSLSDAIRMIESSDIRLTGSSAPAVEKPWISLTNLAVTSAMVLVVGAMSSIVATKVSNPGKTVTVAEAASGAALPGNAGNAPGPAVAEDADPDRLVLDKNLADFQSPDRNTRLSAAWDLMGRKVGPRRDEVRKAANSLLQDPEAEARKRALRLLGRWGTAEDVAAIAAFARDPDQFIRAEALQALGQMKQASGIVEIMARFREKEDRSIAAAALKNFGKDAARSVAPLLDDSDPDIQLEAARVLEQIGNRATIPELQTAFERYKASEGFPTADEFNNPTARHAREMANTLKNALNNAANR